MELIILRFAEFELDIQQRRLLKDGALIRLGSRAFDLLTALVLRANQVIAKEDLIREVWPNTTVSEGALRVHMASLRKALGLGSPCPFLRHVANQGYIFEVNVEERGVDPKNPRRADLAGLPAFAMNVIGRRGFVESCLAVLDKGVLTIVGPGGIGKTTVASLIVQEAAGDFEKIVFVDLGALAGEGRIALSLASQFGLTSYGDSPLPGIIKAIGGQRVLLFFDNCEHLVDEAANVIEELTRRVPKAQIIATSREPLRIQSETVRRLGPLEMPSEIEAEAFLTKFPAVELFLERASLSMGDSWTNSPGDLSNIATIVRKLDGIPLAIELAAARIVDLGISALLQSLDSPLTVLRRGRRTAPPRQQTLRATLDWSYSYLSEDEKQLLMLLSSFARAFSYNAATAISRDFLGPEAFDDALTGLLAKSLISQREAGGQLKLLETTKEYAGVKLNETTYAEDVRGTHARFVLGQLPATEQDWDKQTTHEWLATHGSLIDDLRAGLKWADSAAEHRLFVDLASNSDLLWTQLGLMGEQFLVVQQAIEKLAKIGQDPVAEAKLRTAYGAISYNLHSVQGDDDSIQQFELAAKAAELVGEPAQAVRAYSGICAILIVQGRYEAADKLTWKVDKELGLPARSTIVRIAAHNSHYMGRNDDAVRFALEAIDANGALRKGTRTSGVHFSQRHLALMVMAKTAWIMGSTDRALAILDELLGEAAEINHGVSSCLVLSVGAVPMYHCMGHTNLSRKYLDRLQHVSETNSLFRWKEWAESYELLGFGRSPTKDADDVIRDLLKGAHGPRLENTVVVAGGRAPQQLLDLAISGEAGWCKAELFRLKGELSARSGGDGRNWIKRGLELAYQQKALLWQLRCATSLVELETGPERGEARRTLEQILAAFPQAPPALEYTAAAQVLAA
ncbi:winged helix-turn-helix domain-containing protein [Mesorhizobium sp. M1338]|uniref:ATP-binding protein n=1 Tax=unclassified Mesorhizobium TaxID=325217 RepID=UPI0033380294